METQIGLSLTNKEVSTMDNEQQFGKNGETYQPQYHLIKICRDRNWIPTNVNPVTLCQPGTATLQDSLANYVKNATLNNKTQTEKQSDEDNNSGPSQNFQTILIPIEREEHDPLDLTLNASTSSSSSEENSLRLVSQENMKQLSQHNNFLSNGSSQISQNFLQSIGENCYQQIVQTANYEDIKKRGRKRKYVFSPNYDELNINPCLPVEAINKQAANKQAEVLVAAKSLFSKRTRTLYHWIHPEMSKTQIKSDVNAAWDILPVEQREFYISQVLGRFGFPQCSLMVNPQLKKLPNDETVSSENDETKDAVSSLIFSEKHESWQNYTRPNRRRKRFSKSSSTASRISIYNQMNESTNCNATEESNKTLLENEVTIVEDDYRDDPELSREFEQFKWTLHLNSNHESPC